MTRILNHSPRLSMVMGALVLSACTMIPTYQRPNADVHSVYPNTTNASEGQTSVANLNWQTVYSDPKLQTLITATLAHNPDLRVAQLNIERAAALYRVQRSNSLPSINATAGDTRQRVAADVSQTGATYIGENYSVGLGVSSFEIDLFGRVRSLNAQALHTFLASQAAQRSSQISLMAQVVSAYYTIAADKELLALAHKNLANYEKTYALTEKKLAIGTENRLTLNQQRLLLETARNDTADYRAQIQIARNALEILVGQNLADEQLPDELTRVIQTQPPKTDLAAGVPSDLLTLRPDVMQAEEQLKAANANIGAARAAFFPRISLTAAIGTASTELSRLFEAGNGTWSVAPSAVLPIFNWGSNSGNLKVAKVDQQIAVTNYQKAVRTAFRETADSLAQYQAYTEEVQAAERKAKAAADSAFLSQKRYDVGLDSYLSVLDAERNQYSSEQALVLKRLAQINNQATLYKVLGGGWQ